MKYAIPAVSRCLCSKAIVLIAMLFAACLLHAPPALAQPKEMAIGYQNMPVPFKALVFSSGLERATGYKITWKSYSNGVDVINALNSGEVQIGEVGSSPLTNAVTKGSAIELFWISGVIAQAEALVARKETSIRAWSDLPGKIIAVPNLSTAHYQLFARLAEERRLREVTIKPMPPADIRKAWDAKTIDGAFIWDPVLSHVKQTGNVVVTAEEMARRGYPTFDGLAVAKTWGAANEPFMLALVQALSVFNKKYSLNADKWNSQSEEVAAIARACEMPADKVLSAMAQYRFLSPEQQIAAEWLGARVAKTMADTAIFASIVTKIEIRGMDYSPYVNTAYIKKSLAQAGR